MNPTDPASAREEAERLVATVLATVASGSLFGAGPARGPVATGSAECCVCPLCRVIAAMRDPNPEFAERVATGAGDFAAGVASLLRSLSTPDAPSTQAPDSPPPAASDPPPPPAASATAAPSETSDPSAAADPSAAPGSAGADASTAPGSAAPAASGPSAAAGPAAAEGSAAPPAGGAAAPPPRDLSAPHSGSRDDGEDVWRAATRASHDPRPD